MYEKIIDFYKELDLYDEEKFNQIKNSTKVVNAKASEIMDFIGYYPAHNGKEFRLILPALNDIYDVLIYIHEYAHVLFDTQDEIIPNILEALYIEKNVDENLKSEIINKTKEEIKRTDSIDHINGKEVKIYCIKMK